MKLIKIIFCNSFFCILFLLFTVIQSKAIAQNIGEMEVVYSLPNMNEVQVQVGTIYKTTDGNELSIDVYYPPSIKDNEKLPVVIFALGYSEINLKDMQAYISWGKLVALNGMVGINYETDNPEEDLADLIGYIRKNADTLNIDKNRIGIWSSSGNAPVALSYLADYEGEFIKFGVFYYGIMPTNSLRYQDEINSLSKEIGFFSPKFDEKGSLPANLPLFVVRAGQDKRDLINKTITQFLLSRISVNAPITFVNYKNGQHAFDILDDTQESRRIIEQTLTFMRKKFDVSI